MSYKLLLAGNKFVMSEIFILMKEQFMCLSTSLLPQDVENHLQIFQPDGIVYCLSNQVAQEVEQLKGLKKMEAFVAKPLILVGNGPDCDAASEIAPDLASFVIKRPVAPKLMEEQLIAFLNAKEQPIKPAPIEEPKQEKKQILVVDDDKVVLKLVKSSLEPEFEVTTVSTGKMALKFLELRHVDLILLDYEMPELSGADVFCAIKEMPACEGVPVVFLTGLADRARIQKALSLGPDSYMMKPIDIEKLRNTVHNLMRKS